jgi:hypothetical protein
MEATAALAQSRTRHCLTAPKVSPVTMCRCANSATRRTGSDEGRGRGQGALLPEGLFAAKTVTPPKTLAELELFVALRTA